MGYLALLVALSCLNVASVHAAGLGKMRVLSALGAPFKAEVEVTNLRPEEEAGLNVRIASADIFRQAGIEFNPSLTSIRANLVREGSSAVVALTSAGAVSEPLLEVLVELSWATGRLVRQYTVLLDPVTPLTDNETAQPAYQPPVPQIANTSGGMAQMPAFSAAAQSATAKTPAAASEAGKSYEVQRGDTLFNIAYRLSGGDVKQVRGLMAQLLKNNPDAFINGNKNRLKSGVVLNTPNAVSGDVASAGKQNKKMANYSPAGDAAFSEYKQSAAKVKPRRNTEIASKTVTSQVAPTAAVKPVQANDQLKVSGNAVVGNKAAVPSNAAAEEKIAKERAIAEEKAKAELLKKNIDKATEIKNSKLAAATQAPTSPVPGAKPAPAPAPAVVNPPAAPAPAVKPAAPVAVPAPASAAAKPVEAPVAAKPAPVPAPAPAPVTPLAVPSAPNSPSAPNASALPKPASPAANTTDATVNALNKPVPAKPKFTPPPEPSWYEGLTDDPMVLGGAGGAVALLGGLLIYRNRRAKKQNEFGDSAFGGRDAQGTLLTADGGQAVDTFNSVFSSSFAPGNAALEAAEVDPVAEADVYMQYGRDAHAEDILKDALKQNPNRHAVRLKLMELYASKGDQANLNTQLTQIQQLTSATGKDWQQARQIAESTKMAVPVAAMTGAAGAAAALTGVTRPGMGANSQLPGINLSEPTAIGDVPTAVIDPSAGQKVESPIELNFNTTMAPNAPAAPAMKELKLGGGLDFDMLSPATQIVAPTALSKPAPANKQDSVIDFSMSKFDLGKPSVTNTMSTGNTTNGLQAHETKLSLAQAYMDIGDKDGARELLQEVVASGHQSLSAQAKSLMAKL